MHTLQKKYFSAKYLQIFQEMQPFLPVHSRVLDVGCGNLVLAHIVAQQLSAAVTGIDIIDIAQPAQGVKFVQYDGQTIPFADQSFDVSYLVFVLHHVQHQEELMREVRRVTKKRIVVVEATYRNRLEKFLLELFDLTNLFDLWKIPLPCLFRPTVEWVQIFATGSKQVVVRDFPPGFRPFPVQTFVIDLQ
jgi:2-polyprenyl-3-methyl-5-hydroxy-6-metoxy-1,4-benzoquinol methylase